MIIFVLVLIGTIAISQISKQQLKTIQDYSKSLASYDDFKNLVTEVESHRAQRLISLDDFLKMSQEKNVLILDARSEFRYNRKHLKGAINLNFSDFTQNNLWDLVPPNTKILIYCNNNFIGDQIDFQSKVSKPLSSVETQILSNKKPVMLALNIPTYINLYGYGYKN